MKNNRKGFTIVELVIVIAVIAILAGVLIPTFAGITTKAKKSAALQEARNIYTEYVALNNGQVDEKLYIKVDNYYFVVEDGKMDDEAVAEADLVAGTTIVIEVTEDEASTDKVPTAEDNNAEGGAEGGAEGN